MENLTIWKSCQFRCIPEPDQDQVPRHSTEPSCFFPRKQLGACRAKPKRFEGVISTWCVNCRWLARELFNGTVRRGYSACSELCVKVGVVLAAWKWSRRRPDCKVMLHHTKVCTTRLTVQADGFLRKPTLIPHWKRPETLSPSLPSCGVSMSKPDYEILKVAK